MESSDASTLADGVMARFVAAIRRATRPFVLGVSGLQGSGKSTLAAAVVAAAGKRGWRAVALSLDDVYLTRHERQALARTIYPLLRTRGVPGTHDLALLTATLDALGHATPDAPVAVPRFDKGHDERKAASRWPVVPEPPTLIVIEGWCLGLEPQDDAELHEPVNALERDEDPHGIWRRWVNGRLAEYLPIWRRLDAMVLLEAPSWWAATRWRDDAERPLRERGDPHAMDTAALSRFLQHYERLSRWALVSLKARADMVVTLDASRTPSMHRGADARPAPRSRRVRRASDSENLPP